jgi:hypothetical protein
VAAETEAMGGGEDGGEGATQAGGGGGIPAPNPPVHRRDVFIKQTSCARYGEGRGVRMGAAVAAETEAGGGGEHRSAARRGASPRLPPLLGDKGGEGGDQRLGTILFFEEDTERIV